jgi:hypothetical protein
MASTKLVDGGRPKPLKSTKSFSRYESHRTSVPTRSRASTLSNEVTIPPQSNLEPSMDNPLDPTPEDVFARRDSESVTAALKNHRTIQSPELDSFPEDFDELPVELISLSDR